jgi:hypothetical protein
VVLLIILFLITSLQAKYSISGIVVDKETEMVIPGVKVTLNNQRSVITDEEGRFCFQILLREPEYELRFEKPGYELLIIKAKGAQELKILLIPKIFLLETVEVSPSSFGIFREEPQKGVLAPQEILALPGGAKDIFFALQTLPGVASVGSSGPLYVRGGKSSENLVLVDNIRISSPFHLETVGGGLFSIFNSDTLEKVEIFTGGFGAKYGGKLSAVIDIKTRSGDEKRHKGISTLHMAGFEVLLEGPLFRNVSYLFSARRSFFDLVMKMMRSEEASGVSKFVKFPNYYDFQSNFSYEITPQHTLKVGGIFAHSGYKVLPKDEKGKEYIFKSEKLGGLVSFNSILTEKILSETTVCGGSGEIGSEFYQKNILRGKMFQIKKILSIELSQKHLIELGLNLDWDEEEREVKRETLSGSVTRSQRADAWNIGVYLSDKWRILERMVINTGLRYDYLGKTEQGVVSPRLNFSFQVHPKGTLFGAWGYYYQFPSLWLFDSEFGNPNLKASLAEHYILGYRIQFTPEVFFKLEGYYKKLDNLITRSDTPPYYLNDGFGSAKGVEVFLQRKGAKFTGWLSYAFSEARRKEGESEKEVLFDFDMPHILSAVFHYELPWGWSLGVKARYLSGRPKTPLEEVIFDPRSGNYIPSWGKENSVRYPEFHQLDIRIMKEFAWGIKGFFFLEVMNAYARRNISFIYFNRRTGQEQEVSIFPTLLPVAGVMLKF